jgi:membrane fusion protein, heavy metal efflux system
MNINDAIKTPIINTIFTFTLCFSSTLALAENDHSTEEEHGEEEGHIELSQEQIKHAGISLSRVESGNIRETLPVYGVVTSNTEQIQSVSARFEGVIRSVNKKIGDQVRRGEILVTVEANESLKTYSVPSSLNGVITQRNANIGEQTTDRALFVVEDFSTVWVDLSLFPKDVSKVKLGQSVRIKSASNPISGEGNIIYIAPLGNSNNQATTARVLLNNADNLWKPGIFINAEITLSETAAPTVIQSDAVQLVEGETVIFVKGEEGFEPREITLGRTDGESSEVLSGLKAGETYVAKNSFVLKSEMGKEDAEHGH